MDEGRGARGGTSMVKVKICGLMRRQDVEVAAEAGADYVGVVLSGGFGRSVDPARAAELVRDVVPTPVAVLVDESPEGAEALARALGAGVVQLHGDEPPETVREIGRLGNWRTWKSVRVRGPGDVARAIELYGELVDGLLLEGYRAGLVGGGGAILDLDDLERILPGVPSRLEIVLAGGLTPDNVGEVVARFRPSVVDVSSGVESEVGLKDEELVRRFVGSARAAADYD